MKKTVEIGIAFPRGSHQEIFIEGMLRFAHEHGLKWSFMVAPESSTVSITQLVGWPGDGVVAALHTAREGKCASSFHLPVVNISGALAVSPAPRATVDNEAIGTLAAEHFLERGYENFAFYGIEGISYSDQRLHGFSEKVSEQGFEVSSHLAGQTFHVRGNKWLHQQAELTDWVRSLKPPCAVLSASDARARQVIAACDSLQLRVPDQIAVMGVDDQQIICEHTHPSLSSIARNSLREGVAAAEMLHYLMSGNPLPIQEELIPPLGIVERESTDIAAIEDDRLRDALAYFQEHIEEPVSVGEVCRHTGVSRRWLEYAFRETLGVSPFDFIRRQRLKHARRLLRDERSTAINIVARRSGYSSSNQLAKAFKAEFGLSPRDYRKSIDNGKT